MKVLFCGVGDQAAAYAPALKRWSAELDAPFDLFTDPGDIAPGDVDVLIALSLMQGFQSWPHALVASGTHEKGFHR